MSDVATDGGPDAVLAGLLAGTSIATWCYGEPPPHDRLGDVTPGDLASTAASWCVHGVKRPVESADRADHLLRDRSHRVGV